MIFESHACDAVLGLQLPPSSPSQFIAMSEDEVFVQESIQQIELTVESVENEIMRLRRSLTELENYRGQLYERITRHQAILSPIRKLPTEILAEIFLHAADDSKVVWPRKNGEGEIPLLLGKICSYWRTLSHALPQLWSKIRLDIPQVLEGRSTAGVKALAEMCLFSRSRNTLLSFSIKADGPPELIEPLLQGFAKHSSR